MRPYTPEMTWTDCMCREKKEERDSQALKITSIQRLGEYIKNHGGRLITATRNNADNTSINRTKISSRKWEENNCMAISRNGNLKKETESLLRAAQNNTIRTNYIKVRIDKTQQNSRCRLCGERDET